MKKHIILLSVLAMITMTGCGSKESAFDTTTTTDTATTADSATTADTNHTYSSSYSYDDEYHWKKCTATGHSDTTAKEKHVYDNNLDEDCNVCGYTRTIKHTYEAGWHRDETSHWKVCTEEGHTDIGEKGDHTFGEWTVSTPATYTTDEILERECTVCGRKEEKTNPNSKLPKQSRELSVSDIADITYDGLAHPITDDMITRTNDFGGIKIEYKAIEKEEYTTDAPIDCGVYDYRVTLNGTEEWEEKVVTGQFAINQYTLSLTKTTFESLGTDANGDVILHTYDVSTISNGRETEVHLLAPKSYNTAGKHTIETDEITLDNVNYYLELEVSTISLSIYDTADLRVTIRDVFTVSGSPVIQTNNIIQGTIHVGDTIYVNELGKSITVTKLSQGRTAIEKATVGEAVSMMITGATKDELYYGMLLTTGEALPVHQSAFANITVTEKYITSGNILNIHFPDYDITKSVRITLSNKITTLMQGETNTGACLNFASDIANWAGRNFEIKVPGNSTVRATGTITTLHDHSSDFSTTGTCSGCGISNVTTLTPDSSGKADSGYKSFFKGEAHVFKATITPASEVTKYKLALNVPSTSDSASNYSIKVMSKVGKMIQDITDILDDGVFTVGAAGSISADINLTITVAKTKQDYSFTSVSFSITKL